MKRAALRRRALLGGAALLTTIGGLPLTLAQTPPGTSSSFEFAPGEGPPGTIIAVSGTCLFHGQGVSASVRIYRHVEGNEEPFDTFQRFDTDADGRFAGDLPVPMSAPPDEYGLTLTCLADDQAFGTIDETFVVTAPPAPPPVSPPAAPAPQSPTFTG